MRVRRRTLHLPIYFAYNIVHTSGQGARWLARAAGLALLAFAAAIRPAEIAYPFGDDVSATICDSHAHLISDDPARYPFSLGSDLGAEPATPEPMTAERLIREMDETGVAQALAVQRATLYRFDNRYVCDSARTHPTRLRAVCSIDTRLDECGDQARALALAGAAGFRLMEPERGGDLAWLGGQPVDGLWRVAADLDLPVCVHLFPWNRVAGLEIIAARLDAFPDVPVVIDHLSNLALDDAGLPRIDEALRWVAGRPLAIMKFTTIPLGRLAEAGLDAAPLLRAMVGLFGADRLIWGSDVAQSSGSYRAIVELGRASVRELPAEDQARILGGTARRLYRFA